MKDCNLCDGCAVMSPKERQREIPLLAVCLLLGAWVYNHYKGNKDTVAIEMDYEWKIISLVDYEITKLVLEKLNDLRTSRMQPTNGQIIDLIRMATDIYEKMETPANKRGVIMLKDRSGSGYWRMVFPARYLEKSDSYIDITAAGVKASSLMEYETIFVQRLHDWESYYLLEKLKRSGKRIVYDLDDDIFNIDKNNPAEKLIGRDDLKAAEACIKLADVVTTTVEPLKNVIIDVTGVKDVVVISNAMDMDLGWRATPLTGSPDGLKRIFWQGGESHGEDWMECIDAIDAIMGEREDVRLVIFGYLPPIVISMSEVPHWKGKIEFLRFSEPETYFEMMKHVRAEVGIAPLKNTMFNQSKSSLKFMEYAATGMPTVASDEPPYSDVIEHGIDGFIADNSQEWFDYISLCLDDKRKRLSVLEGARRKVREQFNIKKTVDEWKKVLLP